jgi:hypothetical protein
MAHHKRQDRINMGYLLQGGASFHPEGMAM